MIPQELRFEMNIKYVFLSGARQRDIRSEGQDERFGGNGGVFVKGNALGT